MRGTVRPELDREVVATFRRERVARGIAEAVQEIEMGGLRTIDIAAAARMAKATFFDLFPGKSASVEYACEFATLRLTQPLAQPPQDSPRRARLEWAIDTLIEAIEAEPLLAGLCLVHSRSARTQNPERYFQAVVDAVAAAIGPGRCTEVRAGAIVAFIALRLAQGRGEDLATLRTGFVGIAGFYADGDESG
jgi:AcrR family transcriptional regulator